MTLPYSVPGMSYLDLACLVGQILVRGIFVLGTTGDPSWSRYLSTLFGPWLAVFENPRPDRRIALVVLLIRASDIPVYVSRGLDFPKTASTWTLFTLLLRGAIVNRTYGIHENLYI